MKENLYRVKSIITKYKCYAFCMVYSDKEDFMFAIGYGRSLEKTDY